MVKIKLMNLHKKLIKNGKYKTAALLYNFLKNKNITLGISDAEWELDEEIQKIGIEGKIIGISNFKRVPKIVYKY